MKILMYGVSQETVSVNDMNKYSLSEKMRKKHIRGIKEFSVVKEVVLLSTSSRNEYYLHVDEKIFKHGDLLRYFTDYTEKSLKEIILETYSKFNDDVIRHLFSVASGMESAPKDRIESLHSTEKAFMLSKSENTISFVLKDLFEKAVEFAREFLLLPQVAPFNQEESSKSIRVLQEKLSGLTNKKIVLFGSGYEVIHLVKTLLYAQVDSITVANTNYQTSRDIVNELENDDHIKNVYHSKNVHATNLDNVMYRLSSADGAIISSSVEYTCLSESLLSESFTIRQTKKTQVIVDLSETQEEYLFYDYTSALQYYNIKMNKEKSYTSKEKEEAMTYYDEILQLSTDRFMERYKHFIDKREKTAIFTKQSNNVHG